jgi:hypothetical protein
VALMERVRARIKDKRVLALVQAFRVPRPVLQVSGHLADEFV